MIVQKDFDGEPLNLRKTRKRVRVSDHAVLRYMERVLDWPVAQIRRQILTDGVVLGVALKAQSVRVDGHQVIIQGRVITTILAPDMIVRRRRRKRTAPNVVASAEGVDQ